MRRRTTMLLGVCVLIAAGCIDDDASTTLRGPYLGQPRPGPEPRLFAPGLLSTSLHDDCPAVFSPDGREVFFRKWAVPHDIVGHMRMDDDGAWSEPALFRPDGDRVFLHPVFVPGTDLALMSGFRPRRSGGEVPDCRGIWQARRDAELWTDWTWSELNFASGAGIWSIDARGTAYLQAPAADGRGSDFYAARRVADRWEDPVRLDIELKGVGRKPCISPAGDYLVFNMRGEGVGHDHADLYVSFPRPDGTWTTPRNLGEPVNGPYDEKFAAISPDGAYLFYVSTRAPERRRTYLPATYAELMAMNEGPGNGLGRGDVYWVSTEVVERLR